MTLLPAAPRAAAAASPEAAPPAAEQDFRRDLVAIVPSLRAFARGLCGNRDLADDLAQEALAKAWAARESFAPGTNFRAWMFRILRNHFYSVASRAKRMTAWDPEAAERLLVAPPNQGGERTLADLERGLATLPAEQREALLLMEGGMAWEDIATVMDCPLGTVKSRITRARRALKRYLEGPEEISGAGSG
ncbi:MAG: sigma-70 family RNA polymerase sigma factor [Sphingomonadaceae bacterium]